jgi:hypothetical protein
VQGHEETTRELAGLRWQRMHEWHLYEELKGWQGGIGSLLGLVALMLGALFNFHLNRKRDAILRTEEALSVAAALYGEIVLLRKQAAKLACAVAAVEINQTLKLDTHFVEAQKLSEPTLYKALAPKIGLLSPDLVLAITEFHKNFQEARSWLPLLVENKERGYGYFSLSVLEPARDAVINIVPALREIERIASIPKPAEDPDLGLTEVAIESDEYVINMPREA